MLGHKRPTHQHGLRKTTQLPNVNSTINLNDYRLFFTNEAMNQCWLVAMLVSCSVATNHQLLIATNSG